MFTTKLTHNIVNAVDLMIYNFDILYNAMHYSALLNAFIEFHLIFHFLIIYSYMLRYNVVQMLMSIRLQHFLSLILQYHHETRT